MMLLAGQGVLVATYYILQKPVFKKYPPITVTGYVRGRRRGEGEGEGRREREEGRWEGRMGRSSRG